MRFLSDEANQLAGWDGLLDCDSQVLWAPDGTSVWELGAESNARQKIRKDFADRCARDIPAGWRREDTTYVAVTLRQLDNLDQLENELKAESPWKDVRIHDGHALTEWIEKSLPVQVWLQGQGVGPPSTIQTVGFVWSVWSEETQPVVSTKLILAGREAEADRLRTALGSSGGVINVQADSSQEAVAFVFAAVDAVNDEFGEHFLDSSIIVSKQDDAAWLRDAPQQYVILVPPATQKAELLARFGHTVINAIGNSAITRKEGHRLQRALTSEFTKALVGMGLTEEQSEIEARACGRSPSVWRVWNLLQRTDVSEIPDWAKEEVANDVIPAVLLGGWSENFEGDKQAVAAIAGAEFDRYRDQLHPFLSQDDPLLTKVGDAWVVTAPATAFALLCRLITPGHIQRLSQVVFKVFSEVDPAVDLPPDERPYTALRTGGMTHSDWLRDGLAETLLRIAVIGEQLEDTGAIPGNQSRQSFVDGLIRQLPRLSEDWRLLASLRNQLPVLAEASPYPFLEALERLLQGPVEGILPIFEEGDSTFGPSFHPALWWALETLAWEPLYLGRVALILAGLARIDPGGRLENRPINSLRNIFLAWKPDTSADLKQRLDVLDLILEREPKVGWDLLIGLMPKYHAYASHTNEPLWRDFSRSKRERLTHGIVRQAYMDYIDRAIRHAGVEPSRCQQLIQVYAQVSETHQTAIEERLKHLAVTQLEAADRDEIWNTLRDFINRNRQFADATWALPSSQLDRLDEIRDLFEPTNPEERLAWLFNETHPDVPVPGREFHALEAELKRLRAQAAEQIWRSGGIGSLMHFLGTVSYPGLLSLPILDLLSDEVEVLEVYHVAVQGSARHRAFAALLSREAYYRFQDNWTNMVISVATQNRWPAEAIAGAFLEYPDSKATFNLVQDLGPDVEREYWQGKRWVQPAKDTETTLIAIEKLMAADRALDVIALTPERLRVADSEQLLNVLDQALAELNEGKAARSSTGTYWIDELFGLLGSRSDVDVMELARREYAFLPLLTRSYEKRHLALHELMSTNPDFFVHVICDLYKARSAEKTEDVDDDRRRRAEFAWKLLRSWRDPPGLDAGMQVDAVKLQEWVTRARFLASEKDRKIIADQHIGNVLCHYPADPTDSAWPHIELRRLIEDLQSDDIENGIGIEQLNARGVVSYSLFEGGDQERALAQKWRNWALILGVRWPRTRHLLERIAESWDREAARRDQDAEKERLRSD